MKILTWTGKLIEVPKPCSALITIEDVAQGTARQYRFNGLTVKPYTVAQHSVIVSRLCVTPLAQLYGLLHDASEAYLHDIPTPIKSELPDYKTLEDKWMKVIIQALAPEFSHAMSHIDIHSEVSNADRLALRHEVRGIAMHPDKFELEPLPEFPIIPELTECGILEPKYSAAKFTDRYNQIIKLLKK